MAAFIAAANVGFTIWLDPADMLPLFSRWHQLGS